MTFVQDGDFLSAIELTRSYYIGDAIGNTNGLPDDPQTRKEVIGTRMRDLMVASARYVFSEDRMTDGTHATPDGRGVDRTSLFEGLVATCCRACVALDDFEFLFEDLFQQYDDSGIARIFLIQLETFVLANDIRHVPPRITQRLVALHDRDDRPDLVERIIWHIDPACLDINQAIHLCQAHNLYDALIYVYTRALRDYVAPVVVLLGLIRRVQQYHKSGAETDVTMENNSVNAYKIYPYLAHVLSGLTYPSEEPLVDDEAFQAKKDVYTFLFFGRSSVWPTGDGGKLVLTSDEDGGVEPTYPYARLLLRFDAESFLHSLDIAFEDAYLNDESQGVSRLVVVHILLEILTSGDLPSADITLVNIFISRNVPKYPQFLQIAPSALHSTLVGLAEDPDPNTREDRQLAAEYLLSVYNPHESERILHLFESAGFYRILRTWYRQDRRWALLFTTYLDDPDLRSSEVFHHIDGVLDAGMRANKGTLPSELFSAISEALPQMLQASVTSSAALLDKYAPDLHEKALDGLGEDADHDRFVYLRHLLWQARPEEDYGAPTYKSGPSLKVPKSLRRLYISLHCQFHPSEVIPALKNLPPNEVDWPEVLQTCESREVYDAVIWALNSQGDARAALSKLAAFEKQLTRRLVDTFADSSGVEVPDNGAVQRVLHAMESLSRTGITVCLERSQGVAVEEISVEDLWFELLSSQIHAVQAVSGCFSNESLSPERNLAEDAVDSGKGTIGILRTLVQETFGGLVSVSSTSAVSFPRLFKRLVDSASRADTSTGTQYTEFRIILTGMLESYRSEGDMLLISKHLIDRDLFETVAKGTRERERGWAPSRRTCLTCRKPFIGRGAVTGEELDHSVVLVSRTGAIYHQKCFSS